MSADGTTSCAKLHCAGLPAPPWKRPCEPANASARRCFTPFSLLLDWSQFKEFVDAQPLKAVINLEAQAKWIGLSDSAVHGLNRETTTDAKPRRWVRSGRRAPNSIRGGPQVPPIHASLVWKVQSFQGV